MCWSVRKCTFLRGTVGSWIWMMWPWKNHAFLTKCSTTIYQVPMIFNDFPTFFNDFPANQPIPDKDTGNSDSH